MLICNLFLFIHSADSKSMCGICNKVVYPAEFIGASGKAFHKTCFRCNVCKTILRADNYATVDNEFFCRNHYEQAFKASGGTYNITF